MAEAPTKTRTVITVRAKFPGTSLDVAAGRHFFRDRNEVFQVFEDQFAPAWQERGKDISTPPPEPKVVPQTTLPAHLQPNVITG